MADRVDIPGLAAFRADFKQMPKDVKREFGKTMKVVTEAIAKDARAKVPSKSGTAASGISAVGGANPGVRESTSPAYLRWLDFGSRNPRTGNTRAEGPWRGSGKGPTGGRFVYPAIQQNDHVITEAAAEAMDEASRQAGFH